MGRSLPYFGAVTESQSLTEPKQSIMSLLLYLKAIVVNLRREAPRIALWSSQLFQENPFLFIVCLPMTNF